jgi:cell division inhibitor SepF
MHPEDQIMDELELQEKPGFFTRLASVFSRNEEDQDMESEEAEGAESYPLKSSYRYHVTIRRDITTFDDAYAAANGLKRGEQQVVNLTMTEPTLRQKIIDFMSGVSFAQDANWEEIGDHIFLVCPAHAFVEVAPSVRSLTFRN